MLERSQSILQPTEEDGSNVQPFSEHKRSALGMLYRAHWTDLCRYISVRFGSGPPEPEEVAQAAFARYASLADTDDIGNPKAYLFTIARHIVLDQHRRLQTRDNVHRDVVLMANADNLSDFSPERVLLGRERLALLEAVLRKMPTLRRRVFLLVRAEGIQIAEVARRCAMAERSVYQHVFRAMREIEAAFAQAEQELDPYNE